ncbi:MAG: hypothetical protein V5A88_01135 [Candidatus Thermoplasmatota archaeon]
MNEREEPIEKYVSVCKECDDPEKRKNKVTNALLKDEMMTIAERNGLEVKKSSTKDEIAEKLVKPEIYEDIVKEKEKLLEEKDEEKEPMEPDKLEEPRPLGPRLSEMDFLSPFSEILSEPAITGPKKINELWMEGVKSAEGNLEKITNDQLDYWENVEKEWMDRASEFQEQIEELRESSELPAEKTKELSVIWRNFYNKMAARLTKLGKETRRRQESLNKITERYRERAEESFTEGSDVRDFGKLFGLWSDFSEDLRREMKDAIEDYEMGYDEFIGTWDKFSQKIEDLLEELQEEQETQVEGLYEQWNSSFDQIKEYSQEGYQEYKETYETFWDQIEEQSTGLTEVAFEMAEEMEENYSNILEGYLETVNRGYENLFNMPGLSAYSTRKEKEVKDLKKRVKELEEQIEED